MKILRAFLLVLAPCLLLSAAFAQEMRIDAQAYGTSTQMGQMFTLQIHINQLSTPGDQKVLLDAFQKDGMDGLTKTVSKMKGKGRLAIPGKVGYEVTYIRVFDQPDGSKLIRMVTDRPINVYEARNSWRTEQYTLTALELKVGKDGKGTGTLLPAVKLKMKNGQIEFEAYQNPWRLDQVHQW